MYKELKSARARDFIGLGTYATTFSAELATVEEPKIRELFQLAVVLFELRWP